MYNDHGYKVLQHQGINEETNLPRWFRAINTCSRGKLDDMKYVQFVTVAEVQ
jgi:hypothetical protein